MTIHIIINILLHVYTLKDSRQGVNLIRNELVGIAPPLKKGQPVYVVLKNHPEIKMFEKILYKYIESGLFKDWGIDNLALKRQLNRRQRSTKLNKRAEPADYTGRKYEDYPTFIKIHQDMITTEMDTV